MSQCQSLWFEAREMSKWRRVSCLACLEYSSCMILVLSWWSKRSRPEHLRPWHENQCTSHAKIWNSFLAIHHFEVFVCFCTHLFVKFVSNRCKLRVLLQVKPWSYVFTSICAIIGGAFSVATLVWILSTSGHVPLKLCPLKSPVFIAPFPGGDGT